MSRVASAVVAAFALALAACGGGGNDDAASPTTAATGPVTVSVAEDTAQPEAEPTGDPEFTIELDAESDTPTAGRPWRYVVTATSADGAAAGGTAKIRVFVEDELVDTVGFFTFENRLERTHVFPRSLRGQEGVVFQAEVEGSGGTQRANLPVIIR